MTFSQRYGFKNIQEVIQKDFIDDALRNRLWNCFYLIVFSNKLYERNQYGDTSRSDLGHLFISYWHGYFKSPLDNMPDRLLDAIDKIKKYFFECEWYEIYDFIEFTINYMPDELQIPFISACNMTLEKELSAYRIVDKLLVEVTSSTEIESINEALENSKAITGAHAHLKSAINFMADRNSPDFRNSIKESISAVESTAQTLTKNPKATLGQALKELEEKHNLHEALKRSLTSLYGYTSDADGIRHAMMEESNLTLTDAKFMLVSCTAFINYLIEKSQT